LKSKSSYGYEEISTKIIKLCKPFIISPLINICNKVLAIGNFPERLKFLLVKSIYKSGDKCSPVNYRPISLLPSFSKIFEKVMLNRLCDRMNRNSILNEYQYGFRSDLSIENASYILLNEILTAMN
jgi:Notch-like protein